MNSPNTTRRGHEPAGRAIQPARDDKPAKIQIVHDVTSDCPDGRPSPPPGSEVLWVIVRRAEGCTFWRAIQLAQVRPAATDFENP
jgi:hypothetical protein